MVIGQAVNLRSEPYLAGTVITILNSGVLVKVVELHNQWYRVRLQDEQEGWIYKDFITVEASEIKSRTCLLAKSQAVTDYAKKLSRCQV